MFITMNLAHTKQCGCFLSGDVCRVFPRMPDDVTTVRMMRNYVDKEGCDKTRACRVRRKCVLEALWWLKAHHKEYREDDGLTIDESNLNWMNGAEEADLSGVVDLETTSDAKEDEEVGDKGCAQKQCLPVVEEDDEFLETAGVLSDNGQDMMNENDREAIEMLKEGEKGPSKMPDMAWPQSSRDAVSEYSSTKIFVNAFPWLFPGGLGDFNDRLRDHKLRPAEWAKQMLYYNDGCFARDPMWCFYALNFVQRHKNQDSGGWFLKNYLTKPPSNLEELHERINKGDKSFIDQLAYFSAKVRGTDAFWRYKKAELYSWIHHHIEKGSGAPTLFMTLSCAEYFWPDLLEKLQERIWLAGGMKMSPQDRKLDSKGQTIDLRNDSKQRNRAVNDYSLVVQEFFQARTKDFLDTVGKELFGIKHYWVRYEFAKGRGQIHAHLLAITDDIANHLAGQSAGSGTVTAEALAQMARERFDLTAIHPATSSSGQIDVSRVGKPEGFAESNIDPCKKRLFEISDFEIDKVELVNVSQMHDCNAAYCLRHKKGAPKKSNS